jgi:hypothetical protein
MLVSFNSWFRVVSRLYALEFLSCLLRELGHGPTGQVLVLVDGGLEAEGDEALDVGEPFGPPLGFLRYPLHKPKIAAQLGVSQLRVHAVLFLLWIFAKLSEQAVRPPEPALVGLLVEAHDASS